MWGKERERDGVGIHSSVKKYCQEWASRTKKNCRDNVFISVPPPPPQHPLLANQHLLKFIGHQAIMHNPSAFTLSFAFHASWLLMCWYFDAVRRRALSLFQFSKGSMGSALAHTDFFPYNLWAPPSFLFFTLMFNIKDEDSKRWGSNVFSLKACIYCLHFHFTQVQTYYEQNGQSLRRLYSVLDTHKDFLTHGYSGRHT